MKLSFLDKLVCPFDKKDLSIKIFQQNEEKIIEGILTCTSCNRYYPIIHGIPIMSPDEYRELKFEIPILNKWGKELLETSNETKFQLMPQQELPVR